MDIGFGMRVFLFGGTVSLIGHFINKNNFIYPPQYTIIYSVRAFGLLANMFITATFPFLCVAGLYRTSTQTENNAYITYIAVICMWFALVSSVLGSFAYTSIF